MRWLLVGSAVKRFSRQALPLVPSVLRDGGGVPPALLQGKHGTIKTTRARVLARAAVRNRAPGKPGMLSS